MFRRSLYTSKLGVLYNIPLKSIYCGKIVAVSTISYASSWFAYIATREGRAYLVDNDVSTITHSEFLLEKEKHGLV